MLSQHRTPNQVAWGVALGVIMGLLPKDNLLIVLLTCCLAVLKINQLAGITCAVALSLVSSWFDPISSWVGLQILALPKFAVFLQRAFEIPLVPWTQLENPVVLGGIILGSLAFLPTFAISFWTISKAKNFLERNQLQQISNDAIRYRKTVTDQSNMRRSKSQPTLRLLSSPTEDQSPASNFSTEPNRPPSDEQPTRIDASSLRIDPVLVESVSPQTTTDDNQFPRLVIEESIGNETILRETVIEIVRYKRPNSTEFGKTIPNSPNTSQSENPMTVANMHFTSPVDGVKQVDFHSETRTIHDANSDRVEPNFQPTNGEESLKYLISHINGSRDQNRKTLGKSHDVA